MDNKTAAQQQLLLASAELLNVVGANTIAIEAAIARIQAARDFIQNNNNSQTGSK